MKKYMAIAGLILVTVIWGGGFVASDMALDSLSPFQIMTIRFLLSSVLMGGISIRNLKGIKKEEVTAGVFMGAALFIGFSLQIIGLQYTTPSKNAFLTATNVVIVPFIAFLICRKKVGFRGIIGAVLAIAGVGLLSLDKDLSLGLGDGLTLICAVGFAFQIFLTSIFVKKYRASVLNFIQMCTAGVLSLVFMIIRTLIQGRSQGTFCDEIMAAFFQGELHLAVFYRYLLDIFRFPVLCVIRKQQQVIVVKFSLQCHKHLSRERAGSFGTQNQWFDCQLFDIILVLAV